MNIKLFQWTASYSPAFQSISEYSVKIDNTKVGMTSMYVVCRNNTRSVRVVCYVPVSVTRKKKNGSYDRSLVMCISCDTCGIVMYRSVMEQVTSAHDRYIHQIALRG